MKKKISAELAAERGELLGEPYTPPGRTAVFDIPAYDDIADLHELFKRFANTAAAYSEAGGNVRTITADHTISSTDIGTTFLYAGTAAATVSISKFDFRDGMKFSLIQLGQAPAQVRGADGTIKVDGVVTTPGEYQGLSVVYADGVWWCVPFGGSGGSGGGPVPVINVSANLVLNTTHLGALVAVDTKGADKTVTVPDDDGSIPVGSVVLVSNVGSSSTSKVTVVGGPNVVLQDRANAKVSRWRSAALIKRAANVWLINAGSSQGTGSVPLPPTLKTAVAGPEEATLTWLAPTDDGGHSITAYSVQKSVDGNTWLEAGTFDATVLSGTVKGLAADVAVQLRMFASNVLGPSDPSNVLSVTPEPASVPVPEVQYTGTGVWQITNYDPKQVYEATTTAGTVDISGSGVVSCTGPDSVTSLSAAARQGSPKSFVYLQRKTYEYEQKCHQECSPNCGAVCCNAFNGGSCSGCQPCPGCGCCGDGSGGADGCICCGGSRGQSCHDVCETVKKPTPSGFNDSGTEWYRSSDSPLSDKVKAGKAPETSFGPVSADARSIGWTPGTALTMWQTLPLNTPPAERVVLDYGTNVIKFTTHGRVLRYYTEQEDPEMVLCHYEGSGWMFRLIDDGDLSWIPAEGCDWEFYTTRMNSKDVLIRATGTLEVLSNGNR